MHSAPIGRATGDPWRGPPRVRPFDAGAIPAGSWADKIKQRGFTRVGGTDAGPLFSIKDPVTGRLTGFDVRRSQMLAHYITGGKGIAKLTKLTITTVDTREKLIQNNSVDAVFATYTISKAGDLNGKTVATESNRPIRSEMKQCADSSG
jgi:hypothetical protein